MTLHEGSWLLGWVCGPRKVCLLRSRGHLPLIRNRRLRRWKTRITSPSVSKGARDPEEVDLLKRRDWAY